MQDDQQQLSDWLDHAMESCVGLVGHAFISELEQVILKNFDTPNADGICNLIVVYLEAVNDYGDFSQEIKAVMWLKTLYAKHPSSECLRHNILWHSKWIMEGAAQHADTPLELLKKIQNDTESLFLSEGESLRPIYALRLKNALEMGYTDKVDEYYEKWNEQEQTDIDDCLACVVDQKLQYLFFKDASPADIHETAKPFFQDEGRKCGSLFKYIARLVPFYGRFGRDEFCNWLMRISRPQLRHVPKNRWALCYHIIYLTLSGNGPKARRLVINALAKTKTANNDLHLFYLYHACALWSSVTCVLFANQAASMTIPTKCLHGPTTGLPPSISMPVFADRILSDCKALASKFDARNGNNFYSKKVDHLQEMVVNMVNAISNPDEELPRR